MQRHSGSGSESPDAQPLSRLFGSLLGTHRGFSEAVGNRSNEQLPSAAHGSTEDDIPEPLKPSIQRYASRWAAAQQRHDSSIRKCKAVDGMLLQLQVSLQRHDDSASLMVREIAQLIETKKQLAALQTQAREIRSVLGGLESLYTRLADSNTSWSVDLVQQESQYRQSRHQHYMHLQQTMDDQYTELCHDSVQMRVDVAARSFQRDLDNYVQWRSQPEAAAGSATGAKSQAAHTTGASAASTRAKSIADVVLASGSWAGDSAANDFFSDDDDDDNSSSTKGRSKSQLGKKKGAGTRDDQDQAAPGVVILQDEDFD